MVKWFNQQSVLIKVILLVIPFVGWVTELLLRWDSFINAPAEKKTFKLIIAIVFTIVGSTWVIEVIDVIWVLVFGHITHAEM